MENTIFCVYVKTDSAQRIIGINSDAFMHTFEGWYQIAAGRGDRYHHAQGNYFPLPLMDENGAYRYKLEDGVPIERTAEEMTADVQEEQTKPTMEERMATQEEALEMLLSGVTE